jgi:hypothetical protein
VIADPKTSKPTKGERGDAVPGRLRPTDIRSCVLDAAYEGGSAERLPCLDRRGCLGRNGNREVIDFIAGGQTRPDGDDAFAFRNGPHISFPKQQDPMEDIRRQMLSLAKAFRGPAGTMVKALLAETQFDQELAKAFLNIGCFPGERQRPQHFRMRYSPVNYVRTSLSRRL